MINNLYIVMPAYNEAENIETTIKEWYPVVERLNSNDCKCHLVIANDGSKDNTYHKMLGLRELYPMLIPLDKPNSGHGATVLYLYRYAIEQGADFVFQTDSDGQTNPNEIWQMIEHAEDYDFQIGNRNNRQDGMSRVFVTKVLKMIVWLMFHVWVTDANTPFRLMNVERLKRIMAVIPEDYFLCNVAISAIAVKWHERCKWYPITFKPRQGGVNSINMKRIVKIGRKALNDFYTINKNLRHVD